MNKTNPGTFVLSFKMVFYTHWHVSTVVYKWWHLADWKLLQFIKQQKIHFVNKHACVTKVLAEIQQMALVVCHSVFLLFLFFIYVSKVFNFSQKYNKFIGSLNTLSSVAINPIYKLLYRLLFCDWRSNKNND